jgi:hypothetical protein
MTTWIMTKLHHIPTGTKEKGLEGIVIVKGSKGSDIIASVSVALVVLLQETSNVHPCVPKNPVCRKDFMVWGS